MKIEENMLFYGDNLEILREYIDDESIDLIYLDPPFSSNRAYNVIYREASGKESPAQIAAFDDFWKWDTAAEKTFAEIVTTAPDEIVRVMKGFLEFVGRNPVMAYLVMMTIRLLELHRVLKNTGAIYLHCDPTASHYLKIVMDMIFDKENFRNEIIWKRTTAHSDARRCGAIHDTLLFYTKSHKWTWNKVYVEYPEEYIERYYRYTDKNGRRFLSRDMTAPGGRGPKYEWHGYTRYWRYTRENMEKLEREGRIFYTRTGFPRYKQYLDEMPGVAIQDVWTDIHKVDSWSPELLGYQTQKPLPLLERIIQASSNEGDIVLDPFCGCGTTVVAAHRLKRKWIGIDITPLAIGVMESRLADTFGAVEYEVIGLPVDMPGARTLAATDPYAFQLWAVGRIKARPAKEKRGADEGVDGIFYRIVDDTKKPIKGVAQVKSGHVHLRDIREFIHVMKKQEAQIGVFVTLEPPTGPMKKEALAEGFYEREGFEGKYPRIQILTVKEILGGKGVELPSLASSLDVSVPKAKRDKPKPEDLTEKLL